MRRTSSRARRSRARSRPARSSARSWRKSRRPRWPTSTRTTSRRQSRSSKAPRARWACKWWRADEMAKLTKKNKALSAKLDSEKLYGLEEALKTLREAGSKKFDETVEIAMNLGVDPRHADQMVRGMVSLPSGTGKDMGGAGGAGGGGAAGAGGAGAGGGGAGGRGGDRQA